MNQRLKTKWVNALRSGKYKQGKGKLRQTIKGVNHFCCLGVLCDIQGVEKYEHQEIIAHPAITKLLSYETRSELAKLNDKGHSFRYIARYIESRL